jgi:hypothetical protein
MPRVLYADDWATLTLHEAIGVVRYERTEKPYASIDELKQEYANLGKAVPVVAPGLKLLVDVRRAPPRNDEAFESRVNEALATLLRPFAKHALLVRTHAGKLQGARMARERGNAPHVFDDERAALAYLAAP